jgi:hypothetical protein
MRGTKQQSHRGNERGQAMVIFAIILPLILAFGSFVITIGNWWVHKRHLQTQVDAAALATAPDFVGCFFAPDAANQAIATQAVAYAGDTRRDPATVNLQVQQPDDVFAVLNSSSYWAQSNGTDPNLPTPGYGLDYSMPPVDSQGNPTTDSKPCSIKALDVKATDDEAPTLWGWLPFVASPKAHAKVEIRRLRSTSGMLPLAVPEVDPQAVAAIFVDEEDGSVLSALELNPATCPAGPYKCWALDFPSVLINTDNIGVVVLLSRGDPDPDLGGTLTDMCTQDPGFVICHAGDGNQDGLSFIHGYSTSSSGVDLQNPRVRDVDLIDVTCAAGGDLSSPYFLFYGECTVNIQAIIDFGTTLAPDPTTFPNCVHVTSNPGGTMTFAGDTPDGALFTGSFTLAEFSGRNVVDIDWESRNPARNNCNQRVSGTFPRVAAPYVANDDSGPVQYLTVENLSAPFGLANSTPQSSTARPIRVTVGLQPPLEALGQATDPPILLRLGSNPGSQTQALDCDDSNLAGPSGNHSNFVAEFTDGCLTTYEINYDDWSVPPDGTLEWADIDCSEYPYGNQPPPLQINDPLPNCIAIQTGVAAGQFKQAIENRFASPCSDNNWPDQSATPQEVEDFFDTYDFTNDKRYVTLVVADFTAFQSQGSSEPRPLKVFAGFYYTGSGPVFCQGDDPHPLGVTGQRARFDMWGHFVNIVEFSGQGTPSDDLCNFGADPSVCIAVLVE